MSVDSNEVTPEMMKALKGILGKLPKDKLNELIIGGGEPAPIPQVEGKRKLTFTITYSLKFELTVELDAKVTDGLALVYAREQLLPERFARLTDDDDSLILEEYKELANTCPSQDTSGGGVKQDNVPVPTPRPRGSQVQVLGKTVPGFGQDVGEKK